MISDEICKRRCRVMTDAAKFPKDVRTKILLRSTPECRMHANVGTYYSRLRKLFWLPIVRAEHSTAASNRSNGIAAAKDSTNSSEIATPEDVRQESVSMPAKQTEDHMQIVTMEEVRDFIAKEPGINRVKSIFEKDYLGHYRPDAQLIMLGTGQAALLTFLLAAHIGARQAGAYYITRHQAAKYETKFKAMRSYYDAVLVGGVAHGAKYAVKVGYFTGLFLLLSQSIAAYRNKSSPWEYTAAGAVTGASLRISLGVRGILVSSLLGGTLGFLGGLCFWGLMTASGDRQQDRYFRYIQERFIEERRLQEIQELAARRAQQIASEHQQL